MNRLTIPLLLVAPALFGQYKLEPAGAPPSEVAAPILAELQKTGHRLISPDGKVYCEIWFRAQAPKGPETTEAEVMWKTVPPGSIIGAIKYHVEGKDRRGQAIQPGVYTLRFSMYPINGDHLGVAPNRDFLVMSPSAMDTTLDPVASFDALVDMSRKVSGRAHPAVLSIWVVESDFKPGLHEQGEDWSLHTTVGDAKIAVILIGVTEA